MCGFEFYFILMTKVISGAMVKYILKIVIKLDQRALIFLMIRTIRVIGGKTIGIFQCIIGAFALLLRPDLSSCDSYDIEETVFEYLERKSKLYMCTICTIAFSIFRLMYLLIYQ